MMNAMKMATIALGLLAAGSTTALAQTAPTTDQTPQAQQAPVPCPMGGPGMMMGSGMGHGGMMMGGRGQMMGGGRGMARGAMQGQEITVETVKQHLEARISRNQRLKVGEVKQQPDGTIVATVVTKKEGAVVSKFTVDPKTGARQQIND